MNRLPHLIINNDGVANFGDVIELFRQIPEVQPTVIPTTIPTTVSPHNHTDHGYPGNAGYHIGR